MKLNEIIIDETIPIRNRLNGTAVAQYAHAMKQGETFPPVIVDRKTRKLVSGFHRIRAYEVAYKNPELVIPAKLMDFADEKEMVIFEIADNRKHGLQLTTFDRKKAIAKLMIHGVKLPEIAAILGVSEKKVKFLNDEMVVVQIGNGETERKPIKRGDADLKNETVTEKQYAQMENYHSGWSVVYHCNQIVNRIESDLVAKTERNKKALKRLFEVLEKYFAE